MEGRDLGARRQAQREQEEMSGRNVAVIERSGDPAAERFLELVATTGNSSSAARALGTHRNTWYKRAVGDEGFRLRWEAALMQSRQNIAQDILEKAVTVSGRMVEERVLDANGDPVLDDDLEAVTVRRLVDYDSRILAKMVDKFVASEDGPPVNNILVQNVAPQAPRQRRLVVSTPEHARLPAPSAEAPWQAPGAPRPAIEADFEVLREK
jgi:hypothetical protein